MLTAGLGPPPNLDTRHRLAHLTRREVRWAALLQRQLHFLLPAVGVLSNLAEDPGAQRKMVKRVRADYGCRAVGSGARGAPGLPRLPPTGVRLTCAAARAGAQELPALLVALLGYPHLELTLAVLDVMRRVAIYSVRRGAPVWRVHVSGSAHAHRSAAARDKTPAARLPLSPRRQRPSWRRRARCRACSRLCRPRGPRCCKSPRCAC